MARKKKIKSTPNKSTPSKNKNKQKPDRSTGSSADIDSTNDDEDDVTSSLVSSPSVQTQSTDSATSNSPKLNEISSTPIIHKKFGKVICPDEIESYTTDSLPDDGTDLEHKSEHQDELTYGNQIICEEIEILTTEDVQMEEEIITDNYQTTVIDQHSTVTDNQSRVYEIDKKLQQVSVSNERSSPSVISSTSVHPICTSSAEPEVNNVVQSINIVSDTKQLLPLLNSQCAEIRSRSGSTDTTSSESGSTSSSSVRRSSRIKHTVQHRHREVVDSTSTNGSSKSLSLAPPSPTSNTVDSLEKPVKVKSRWRRTSELEMVVIPKSNQSDLIFQSPHNLASAQSSPGLSPKHSSCDISSLGKHCIDVEEKLKTFEKINFNVYKTDRFTNKKAQEKMICDCFLTKEEWARGEMGCGEDCLNRLLMIECCSRCNLKDRCSNKRFQNLEYAPCEVFKTEMKGFGLRALEEIPSDTFLFEYVGEVVDTKEFHRRALGYSEDHNRHYYFMSLRPDAIIDATIKGNISRFINHSCDPNSETQKWTVDGELRIGFFSRRSIEKGEELTFDYQYQRYGKEAQKCYCGSKNCRGWIGENPDDEEYEDEEDEEEDEEDEEEEEEIEEEGEGEDRIIKSKTDEIGKKKSDKLATLEKVRIKKEKKIKTKKIKRKKPRDAEYVVDDPEKDLEVLCTRGIRNKMDTLAVLRIFVLADNEDTRYKVLSLIQCADAPCRRLIIDYHILKLLCEWMKISDTMTDPHSMKLEILETLSKLPIPDKTKLKDSNILQMVTEWSKSSYQNSEDSNEKSISSVAVRLLDQWSNLVDTFRIPKKERIEQMKEHERQADRGNQENRDSTYNRTWDRYRGDIRKDDRYKSDHRKDRKSNRDDLPEYKRDKGPQLSKYEHRHLFALKVQAEDEERRKQEAEWNIHVERCKNIGLDPTNVSGFDENTGYPIFINPPPMGTMVPCYPPPPTPDMSVSGTPLGSGSAPPIGFGPNGTPIFAPLPFIPPPVPPMGLKLPPPQFHGVVQPPLPGMYPGGATFPPVPIEETPQPPLPPPIRLPKFWKTAKDSEGRIYYYHMKSRHCQWEPPPYQPPPPPPKPPDESSSSSSESSTSSDEEEEDEDEEEDDDEEFDDDRLMKEVNKRSNKKSNDIIESIKVSTTSSSSTINLNGNSKSIDNDDEEDDPMAVKDHVPPSNAALEDIDTMGNANQPSSTVSTPVAKKKKREGLCEEYIISPIQEIEKQKARERKRKIKDTKLKLKQRKLDRKNKMANLSKRMKTEMSTITSTFKIESAAADTSSEPARKIKEQFRLNMAGVIVHYLNPFRKENCKKGRIMSNDDFKHLARKLTHFVLVKELKHCRNVEDLECNDNVKHKAKDFIKKYMSKFGDTYIREKELDV